MEDLIKQIANVGFPIVVTMYLLIRIEDKMQQLTSSIQKLSSVLDKQ